MRDLVLLPPVFRLDQALAVGVPKHLVYAWRDAGEIRLLGRGVFTQTNVTDDTAALLAGVALRQPSATVCLLTALAHHQLTDAIPEVVDVALPRGTRSPAGFEHVTWHRFDPATFMIGRDTVEVAGAQVGIYGPERTIVDVFRLAHLEGEDVGFEALRRWSRRRNAQPSALLAVAKSFPTVEGGIRHALTVLG